MKTDNELIAEFMGGHQNAEGRWYNVTDKQRKQGGYYLPDGFEYHTSWDWLMPVVEKIATIHSKNPKVFKGEDIIMNLSITAPISEVYSESLEFIKFYNSQKDSLKP